MRLLLLMILTICMPIIAMEEQNPDQDTSYDSYTLDELKKALHEIDDERSQLDESKEEDQNQLNRLKEKFHTITMLMEVTHDEMRLARIWNFFSTLTPQDFAYNDTKKRLDTIKNRLPAGRGDTIIKKLESHKKKK